MSLQITLDAQSPSALAHFWAEALPNYAVRPYDAAEIARLDCLGLTPETDVSVALDGPGPTIWFQQSAELTLSRNRIHFDLAFAQRSAEVARLCALGAQIKEARVDHTVMLDPEGNQFCLFDPKMGDERD